MIFPAKKAHQNQYFFAMKSKKISEGVKKEVLNFLIKINLFLRNVGKVLLEMLSLNQTDGNQCVLQTMDTSSQAELSHAELLNRTEVPE